MTRRDREAGIIKSLVIGAALIAGLAVPAYARDTKLTLSGSAIVHDGLHVPQHFEHQQPAGGAARVRSGLRHVLGLHVGIQYRIRG